MLRSGALLNGGEEHDHEVTTIDVHRGFRLIASGDTGGLIKIWNYRRRLIREIKFTEPISAVCFLNAKADLVVGHKGKLSRVLAKDYLPDLSLYKMPEGEDLKKAYKRGTAEIPEDFFALLKEQNDETALQNQRL